MDVVDSPLNMAHQQGRKADSLLKASKYEEAITCHKKAADLLLFSMRGTHNQEALQSLTLQREFHLKQEALIRQKQQISLNSKRKAKKQRPLSGQDQYESDYREPKVKPIGDFNMHHMGTSQSYSEIPIVKMVNECDARIRYLFSSLANSEHKEENQPPGTQSKAQSNTVPDKFNRSNAMDELQGNLQSLKSHAINLVKDTELLQRQIQHYKSENEQLKEKLNRNERTFMEDSTDSEKYYPVPVGMNLHDLPSLELPPLEMPKFDFSALKMEDGENID